MNRIRWVAWGVIDLDDKEKFDAQQRRSYIRKIRGELQEISCTLNCGGSTRAPWYSIERQSDGNVVKKHAAGGPDALRKVCGWLLLELGDHERSEDGSVRSAGAEPVGGNSEGAVS